MDGYGSSPFFRGKRLELRPPKSPETDEDLFENENLVGMKASVFGAMLDLKTAAAFDEEFSVIREEIICIARRRKALVTADTTENLSDLLRQMLVKKNAQIALMGKREEALIEKYKATVGDLGADALPRRSLPPKDSSHTITPSALKNLQRTHASCQTQPRAALEQIEWPSAPSTVEQPNQHERCIEELVERISDGAPFKFSPTPTTSHADKVQGVQEALGLCGVFVSPQQSADLEKAKAMAADTAEKSAALSMRSVVFTVRELRVIETTRPTRVYCHGCGAGPFEVGRVWRCETCLVKLVGREGETKKCCSTHDDSAKARREIREKALATERMRLKGKTEDVNKSVISVLTAIAPAVKVKRRSSAIVSRSLTLLPVVSAPVPRVLTLMALLQRQEEKTVTSPRVPPLGSPVPVQWQSRGGPGMGYVVGRAYSLVSRNSRSPTS